MIFFYFLDFFYVYEHFACVYISVPCAFVPLEVRRGESDSPEVNHVGAGN